jgi:hypothetical protein
MITNMTQYIYRIYAIPNNLENLQKVTCLFSNNPILCFMGIKFSLKTLGLTVVIVLILI